MNTEQFTKLIEAIVALIQALGWPLLVLFLAIYFGAPLKKFLSNIGEFTLKAGTSGLEATAKRQQIEAAALLGAASASKPSDASGVKTPPDEEKAREIANVVSQAVKPNSLRRLAEASVLWVDDNPTNNLYERKSLEALGVNFTISTNTDDALEKLRSYKYDVIISDMGRPPDKQAGYTLLAEKQKLGDKTPYIIYAGSNLPEHKAKAYQKGAIGSTNNPQELFQLVLGAIQSN
ncbi:MAG: response regulator [Dehalococcoidia bacterium]|nr:MAG: response regulator [Dehalococcoidia bacterium]